MKYIEINQCNEHDHLCIAVGNEDGSSVRVTPPKCCGSWRTIQRWPLTADTEKNLLAAILPSTVLSKTSDVARALAENMVALMLNGLLKARPDLLRAIKSKHRHNMVDATEAMIFEAYPEKK